MALNKFIGDKCREINVQNNLELHQVNGTLNK